jgi:DNA-binding MarR family transcriptional regulator
MSPTVTLRDAVHFQVLEEGLMTRATSSAGAAPRWLSAQEQRVWLALLAAMDLLGDELDRQLQRDAGMPHAYYMVLAALSGSAERRMRMSDLALINHASQSRLTHAVNRLAAAGWVRREKCKGDRRVVYAVLTDEGFEALRTAAPGHVEAVRQALFDRLSPEQVEQLHKICDAVLAECGGAPEWPEAGGSRGTG